NFFGGVRIFLPRLSGGAGEPNRGQVTGASTSRRSGLAFALGSHAVWGSMPIYLLLVRDVPPLEYVAWRIVATLPVCLLLLVWSGARGGGGWAELRQVLADRRALLTL